MIFNAFSLFVLGCCSACTWPPEGSVHGPFPVLLLGPLGHHSLGSNCQPDGGILQGPRLIGSPEQVPLGDLVWPSIQRDSGLESSVGRAGDAWASCPSREGTELGRGHPKTCLGVIPVLTSRTKMVRKLIVEELAQLTHATRYLVFVTSLASLQLGYNHWLCYSDTKLIRQFYNLTYYGMKKSAHRNDTFHDDFLVGFATSLFPVGAMVGSLLVGVLVDKFGRKWTMMIDNYISLVCSMFMTCANLQHGFIFAMFSRFFIGISMGIFSSVIPMYLLEISPLTLRGSIGMVPHFFVVIGVQMAQIFSFPELLGTVEDWPALVSLPGLLAIWQILLLPSCPESPRYLFIQKNEEAEAREALKLLRFRSNVEDELEELRREDRFEKDEKKMNTLRLLGYRQLRWHLLSVIVIVAGQQLSGVNVIYLCIEKFLFSTGLSYRNARYFQMMTTALLILAILYGMYIVDTKGRKLQLLVGFGMATVFCLLLTVTIDLEDKFAWLSFLNNVLINIFLFVHAMGPSALINLVTGELFLQSSRSSAYVVGQFLHWLLNYTTVLIFVYAEVQL